MLPRHWWKLARECPVQNVSFFQKSFYSETVKFDKNYGFRIFDKNFRNLKPVEFVGNEFGDKEPVFFFPGIEGKLEFVQDFVHNLQRPVYCFQYPLGTVRKNMSPVLENITKFVKDYARHKEKLNFVAHSIGGLMALSVTKEVQHSNKVRICSMDSTPYALKFMTRASFKDYYDIAKMERSVLISLLQWMNIDDTKQYENIFENYSDWNEKRTHFVEMLPEHPKFTKDDLKVMVDGIYYGKHNINFYDEKSLGKLNAKMSLIRSSAKLLPFPDDFRAEEYFTQPTRTLFVEGHHFNMLKSAETANVINKELDMD